MTKYNCYVASGWFNENQARDLENIKFILGTLYIKYYSPKDELVCPPTASDEIQENVFQSNIDSISDSNFVIVNTRDKDIGTIFEAGVSYMLKKPIIYYCEGLRGNFNLMLSKSGACVATNLEELKEHLINIMKDITYKKKYVGKIE